jgi:hypothetical protein
VEKPGGARALSYHRRTFRRHGVRYRVRCIRSDPSDQAHAFAIEHHDAARWVVEQDGTRGGCRGRTTNPIECAGDLGIVGSSKDGGLKVALGGRKVTGAERKERQPLPRANVAVVTLECRMPRGGSGDIVVLIGTNSPQQVVSRGKIRVMSEAGGSHGGGGFELATPTQAFAELEERVAAWRGRGIRCRKGHGSRKASSMVRAA